MLHNVFAGFRIHFHQDVIGVLGDVNLAGIFDVIGVAARRVDIHVVLVVKKTNPRRRRKGCASAPLPVFNSKRASKTAWSKT